MAEVVVIGGGLGGMAAAARLAKLGHAVTLCEQTGRLGGVIDAVESEGFRWDTGPAAFAFPAPVRDLFHKSGRPLERVFDLFPEESARRHVYGDVVVDLPLTGAGAQETNLEHVLGRRSARDWTMLLDSYEPVWEQLRTRFLESPTHRCVKLRPDDLATLRPWRSLAATVRNRLPDPVTRAILTHHAVVEGADPRRTPAFMGVLAYVERTFGRWTCHAGMTTLAGALQRRLAERRVTVWTDTPVTGVCTKRGAVRGVRLRGGEQLPADIVVAAIDPSQLHHRLLDQRPPVRLRGQRAAAPPHLTHLGLREPLPDLPHETVWHATARGEPTLVLRAPRDPWLAPEGHAAWTVLVYGHLTADPLALLARGGIDLRDQVVARTTTPGVGLGTTRRGVHPARFRPANRSPIEGLYRAGEGAHPGGGVAFVALGAANVATDVGKAPRPPRGRRR